jgi:hypothetical protein
VYNSKLKTKPKEEKSGAGCEIHETKILTTFRKKPASKYVDDILDLDDGMKIMSLLEKVRPAQLGSSTAFAILF